METSGSEAANGFENAKEKPKAWIRGSVGLLLAELEGAVPSRVASYANRKTTEGRIASDSPLVLETPLACARLWFGAEEEQDPRAGAEFERGVEEVKRGGRNPSSFKRVGRVFCGSSSSSPLLSYTGCRRPCRHLHALQLGDWSPPAAHAPPPPPPFQPRRLVSALASSQRPAPVLKVRSEYCTLFLHPADLS